jgi:DHA1 family bicyclomycin/chloramphenicol resistance-like MFS transporter
MRHREIIILAALSMLGALSIDAYLPALPSIAKHFSVSLAASQQTLSVYLFAFAFMMLFYGTLSDSFGRRPVILASLLVYFLSSLGAGLSTSLEQLIVFRLVQGLSAGAGSVVGRAIIGDMLTGAEAQKAMSYTSMVFGLAPAIAPVLGGWLQATLGWRSIFGCIALFCLILLLVCLKWLPESLKQEHRHPFHFQIIVSNYWSVARHGEFIFRCLGLAMTFSGVLFYIAGAPSFVMDVLHLPVTSFGWLFIPLIGGMTLGSMVAGKVSHRWTPTFTITLGYTIMVISSLTSLIYSLLFVISFPWAIVPLGICAFGMALASPAMTIETLELFPKVRGLASSLQGFYFMIIFALGSGLICPLLFGSAPRMAIAAFLGLALSLFFWLIGLKMKPQNLAGE